MAKTALPVVLVPEGQPVTPTNRGVPVTIVGGSMAVVPDGFALTGIEPSGTYTDTVTFTVADGAITAIVLS